MINNTLRYREWVTYQITSLFQHKNRFLKTMLQQLMLYEFLTLALKVLYQIVISINLYSSLKVFMRNSTQNLLFMFLNKATVLGYERFFVFFTLNKTEIFVSLHY